MRTNSVASISLWCAVLMAIASLGGAECQPIVRVECDYIPSTGSVRGCVIDSSVAGTTRILVRLQPQESDRAPESYLDRLERCVLYMVNADVPEVEEMASWAARPPAFLAAAGTEISPLGAPQAVTVGDVRSFVRAYTWPERVNGDYWLIAAIPPPSHASSCVDRDWRFGWQRVESRPLTTEERAQFIRQEYRSLLVAGDTAGAVAKLLQVVELTPGNPAPRVDAAQILVDRGECERAIPLASSALSLLVSNKQYSEWDLGILRWRAEGVLKSCAPARAK